ncbi:D-serine dehydratase [Tremella mesenterica]|uniref:D-serine dehydratase n=1 Tax=Tremella mesenterica TaxID=5217 RepID=A0A4V1M3W3_TREME|nr:D-serine dehydratase [Tremella mesenterica]
MPPSHSTFTHPSLPDKRSLVKEFVGLNLDQLRTPALVIDQSIFRDNCERLTREAERRGMRFRAHVKTHKTIEGTRIQLGAGGGVKAVVCSTMVEIWQIIQHGLVEEGSILYAMPVSLDKMEDLHNAQSEVRDKAVIRLMVDHPTQIEALKNFNERNGLRRKWSVFIKVDGGGKRAGLPSDSKEMKDLIALCLSSSHVEIFGFYSHFGQSYTSDSLDKASTYFYGEVECVNLAARSARDLGFTGKLVLSVGATPTAHAATRQFFMPKDLEGELELHAGNYCMLDLQQLHTSLISPSDIAITVLTRIISLYPLRDEALCDAGALAMSKDTGPISGYGRVVFPISARGWDLGRISQEHGILVRNPSRVLAPHIDPAQSSEGITGRKKNVDRVEVRGKKVEDQEEEIVERNGLEIGGLIRIIPQHACLTCASFPWFYVVDGGEEVVDVWIPWKGW